MSECLSTLESNNGYFFNVGISEHTFDFNGQTITFYVYRPVTMATKRDVVIHVPGRNGNGKEYMEQTMLMNSFNTRLAVCIEMSQYTSTSDFEFGNVFPSTAYDTDSYCLKKNATFNPTSEWTFNIIFRVLDYLKEKLKTEDIRYILNGIDAAGLFATYFNYFYPLMEDSKKQLPEKSIIGVTSFYFFPFSKSRMRLDYLKNVDTSTTVTKTYKEIINYKCLRKRVSKSFDQDLVCSLDNNTVLSVYYQHIHNFLQSISDPVNYRLKDIRNTDVYHLGVRDDLLFPIGTGHVPLSTEEKTQLAETHASQKILYQFYANDTNTNGGVNPEGQNIPNLVSNCQSKITGPFRLFRGLNAFFSSKIDSKNFRWEYIVIPQCGHSSNFANNTILMANAINPEFWKNPRFCPQYFYFLKPELFE